MDNMNESELRSLIEDLKNKLSDVVFSVGEEKAEKNHTYSTCGKEKEMYKNMYENAKLSNNENQTLINIQKRLINKEQKFRLQPSYSANKLVTMNKDIMDKIQARPQTAQFAKDFRKNIKIWLFYF